jgi:hypothetical protein
VRVVEKEGWIGMKLDGGSLLLGWSDDGGENWQAMGCVWCVGLKSIYSFIGLFGVRVPWRLNSVGN